MQFLVSYTRNVRSTHSSSDFLSVISWYCQACTSSRISKSYCHPFELEKVRDDNNKIVWLEHEIEDKPDPLRTIVTPALKSNIAFRYPRLRINDLDYAECFVLAKFKNRHTTDLIRLAEYMKASFIRRVLRKHRITVPDEFKRYNP